MFVTKSSKPGVPQRVFANAKLTSFVWFTTRLALFFFLRSSLSLSLSPLLSLATFPSLVPSSFHRSPRKT